MSQDPSGTYARLLLLKGQGFPLWMPDPNHRLPLEYRRGGVSIGDVGIITSDGAFDFLFNICLPLDHAVNSNGVPDGFETLELNSRDLLEFPGHYIPGTDIASMSIKKYEISLEGSVTNPVVPAGLGGGLKFVCSTSKGAILVLPEGASREDLANRSKFREYASKHAINWYNFINGALGREAHNGSVYLVTGSDKAPAWGVASFSDVDNEQELSLKFVGGGFADTDVRISYSWQDFSPAAVRAGPPPDGLISNDGSTVRNQCVFVRGYKIALRGTVWPGRLPQARLSIIGKGSTDMSWKSSFSPFHLLAQSLASYISGRTASGAGYSRWESFSDGVDLEHTTAEEHFYHPSDIVTAYLLETHPDAQIAIAHDDDWCGILDGQETEMPSDEELRSRIQSSYRVTEEHGASFLTLPGPPSKSKTRPDSLVKRKLGLWRAGSK